MRKLAQALVVAVAVTVGANVFACGGGTSITMTVDTDATCDTVPVLFQSAGDSSGSVEEVM